MRHSNRHLVLALPDRGSGVGLLVEPHRPFVSLRLGDIPPTGMVNCAPHSDGVTRAFSCAPRTCRLARMGRGRGSEA